MALITALTLVLSSGAVAFAASEQTQSTTSTKASELNLTDTQRDAIDQARSESVKEALSQLVDAGTITQDEADKVPTGIDKTARTSGGGIFASLTDDQRQALETERQAVMNEALASLVSAGTITQDQADRFALKERPDSNLTTDQKDAIQQARENARAAAVSSLVSAGTITQTEADAIPSEKADGHKGGTGSAKSGLTSDQMKALMTEEQTHFKSELASLVSAGVITQDQADMFTPKEKAEMGSDLTDAQKTAVREAQKNSMTKAIANLVSEGTITQLVADQLEQSAPSKDKAPDDQNNILTADQRTALQEAVKAIFEGKLAALVSAGTITQEQSDFFANDNHGFGGLDHGGFGGHGGFEGHGRPDSKSAPLDETDSASEQ